MKNTSRSVNFSTALLGAAALVVALMLMSIPMLAGAATYAYVDTSGDVRSVVANDWRTAINTATNIHAHSGVLLLESTADFDIVGNNVSGY